MLFLQGRILVLRQSVKFSVLALALLVAGAVAEKAISANFIDNAMADEAVGRESNATAQLNESLKATLVGSYRVTGTDPDGVPYSVPRIVDVSLTPSGALEFDWDNGTFVGVGQIIDQVLAVAYAVKGRTAIAVMTINSDGSLSGKWLRRTDRGSKGKEIWKKV